MTTGTLAGETKAYTNAAPVDVARDGRIGYKPDHKTGIGLDIIRTDGAQVRIAETPARDVAVIPGRDAAVWTTSKGLRSAGLTMVSVQRPTAKARVVIVQGTPWLLYWCSRPNSDDGGRLVFHPFNSVTGYIVDEALAKHRTFGPDGVQLADGSVLIVFSRNEGESVDALQRRTVFLTDPRVDVSDFGAIPQPPDLEPEPVPPIPNHLDVVKRQRAKYAHLSGPERAGNIVNGVAWELRAEGAGTYYKPSGDNWNNRSMDVIIYQHRNGDPSGQGATFDILGDAEGEAKPLWSRTQPTGYGDTDKFRAATDPADDPEAESEPETGPGPDPEVESLVKQAQSLNSQLTKVLEDLADKLGIE